MVALMNHSLSRLDSRRALFEVLITSYTFLMCRRITAENKHMAVLLGGGAGLISRFAVGKYRAFPFGLHYLYLQPRRLF